MRALSPDSEAQQNASLHSPDAAMGETIARLQRVSRLRTRFPRMERLCRPQSESFWVLGGRPGSFKTGLQWNIALNAAEERQRVLFVSLEMTPGEMGLLALAKFSGIKRERIESHFMPGGVPFTSEERHRWDTAVVRLQGLELFLRIHGAEAHGRGVDDVLRAACRSRFDAVFVDHLGMVGRDGGGRELDVLSHAIHKLRGLSRGEVVKGYRPWVCATSQLNREIDKGDEDRIPRLADFRGSARIEHDTDVAIGLQKRRGAEGGPSLLDGFVLKNRHGACPEILLFEADGSIGLVTERRRVDAPPVGMGDDE